MNNPSGRYGHTMLAIDDQNFLIFGGSRKFDAILRKRECLNDLWIYNTED